MSKDEKGHRLRSPKQQFQLVSGLNPDGLKPGKGQEGGEGWPGVLLAHQVRGVAWN